MRALAKFLPIVAILLYVISPLDLAPDFLPGLGWIDDFLLILGALWYLSLYRRGESPWEAYRRARTRWEARKGPEPSDFYGSDQDDPYTLLGVSRNATKEEIKAAYRRAVARYHPDKVAHLGKEFQELAHQKLLAIQRAYETLTKGEGHPPL